MVGSILNTRNFSWIWTGIGVLGLYWLYNKEGQLTQDADMAREFCPDYVREFMKCQQDKYSFCRKQVIDLHDCIHRFKGDNQKDINRL
mmetsp:Transcript_8403/g.12403  ORF Transcript_8403/g.12403 Transcript_8403/m.12403 type:complete len:88 (-) Transcript_8403:28-291(-)